LNDQHKPTRRITRARFAATGVICLAVTIAGCSASGNPASTKLTTPSSPAVASANTGAMDSDTPPIGMPSLHTGDVWVDRIQGTDREFRIEAIHDGTMDVSFWDTEMTTDTALNIIVYRSLTAASSEPTKQDKPCMWFAFPLYPGKTWENQYNWEMLGTPPIRGKADERGRVLGWEDVQVPAGTFHALKVEDSTRIFGRGGAADEETVVFWYSPKVNRFVKFDYRSIIEGELLAELVRYKPIKQAN
jgi:hypothetical protein